MIPLWEWGDAVGPFAARAVDPARKALDESGSVPKI
jgi:hypothetical protein